MRSNSILRRAATFAAIYALLISAAVAQMSTSQVSGTVTDESAAVVPGAKVALRNEATGAKNEQTTSAAGVYAFPALTVGSYTISVEMAGFKTGKKTGETLVVGTPLNVDFRMEIGQGSETVDVKAEAAALETSNATLGDLVSHESVSKMPLNGRNAQNLAMLLPGAIQTTAGLTVVNGMRNGAFNLTVDGIDANESTVPNINSNLYGLSPDNVQEFKGTTNNPSAEEGRNSGLNMAYATRSGTNEFHGSGYEFFRNTALNASDFYANARGTSKPTLQVNEYGVEVGGPIARNKTFFFFNYEGQDIDNAQPITSTYGTVYLYTPTARQGLFRYFVSDPGNPFTINGRKITGNSPLLVNQQTGALASGVRNCGSPTDVNCVQTFNIGAADPSHIGLDAATSKQFASYPSPNGYSGGGITDGLNIGNYYWNSPYYIRGPHYTGRVDHIIDSKNTLFARYLYSEFDELNGDVQNGRPQILPGQPPLGTVVKSGHNGVVSFRHVFSPVVVNELTAGLSRWHYLFTQGQANPLWPNIPAYTFNLSTTPFLNNPQTSRGVTTPQILDNLTAVKGSHILKTGFNFRFYQDNDVRGEPGGSQVTPTISLSAGVQPPSGFGLPTVASGSTAGINSVDLTHLQSAINDLLGIPATLTQHFLGNLNTNTYLPFESGGVVTLFDEGQRAKQFDSYVQDEWKARRNLTVNYGVRWEVNKAPTEAGGRVYVPDLPIDGSQGPVTFVHASLLVQEQQSGGRRAAPWNRVESEKQSEDGATGGLGNLIRYDLDVSSDLGGGQRSRHCHHLQRDAGRSDHSGLRHGAESAARAGLSGGAAGPNCAAFELSQAARRASSQRALRDRFRPQSQIADGARVELGVPARASGPDCGFGQLCGAAGRTVVPRLRHQPSKFGADPAVVSRHAAECRAQVPRRWDRVSIRCGRHSHSDRAAGDRVERVRQQLHDRGRPCPERGRQLRAANGRLDAQRAPAAESAVRRHCVHRFRRRLLLREFAGGGPEALLG